MNGGNKNNPNRYAIGMLMILGIFGTAITMTLGLGMSQMYAQIRPTHMAAHNLKLYRKDSGWVVSDPLNTGNNAPSQAGKGRVVFLRQGCYFCHTMMVEQTIDYTDFGRPESSGWWYGQRPVVNANEVTGPDLQHVGTRLPSKQYLIFHERYPRQALENDGQTQHVTSVMPDFYWLSNNDLNAVVDFLRLQK